jgi:hypothetical protein
MLFLIAWALLVSNNPALVQLPLAASATVKRQERDSLGRTDTEPIRIRSSVQELPSIRKSASPPGPWIERQFQGSTIDTVLMDDPQLRAQLLRNLLIPQVPFNNDQEATSLRLFNQRLEEASKFAPFERLSLTAKRYSIYNPSDQSLKSYQLDIRSSIHWWLEEALK